MSPSTDRAHRRREQARRRTLVRRRRVALAVLAGLAWLGGVAAGALSGSGSEAGEEPVASASACPPEIAVEPRRLAGQMIVARLEDEATPELVRAARRGEIGGVIAFPAGLEEPRELRPVLRRLQRAASQGGNPPLLVMIDQEGGGASRFPLAPPQRIPIQLAEFGTPRDSRLEGQATGHFLARIGIGVNLAPVLDVPTSDDAAMYLRAFGTEARQVARLGVAFARGLADEDIVAVPKHFPGLGRTEVTTDAAPVTIDAGRRQLRTDLVPFREAIADGAEMLMTSLAAYPAFGDDRPAALSPAIGELLRGELGFEGVVITDDLEAPGVTGLGIDEGEAAVAAVAASADLVLFALGGGSEALPSLARAIRSERLDPDAVLESCARTTELRARAG